MKGDDLSHEEVWDDSALQNSWDDALAEYKVRHHLSVYKVECFIVLTRRQEIPQPGSQRRASRHR